MKKNFLLALFTLVIVIVATVNVNLKGDNGTQLALAMKNIEALADGETGGNNTKDCPGGYCDYTDSFGNKCTACCPTGKDPKCNSFGCECS